MAAKKKEPEVPVEVEPEAVEDTGVQVVMVEIDLAPATLLKAYGVSDEILADLAARARDCAALVAQHVNPTNVFAEKYEALALACEAVTALCAERGHRGIP